MSVEELVQAFEHSGKKANDIRDLSSRFNISEREVIDTLNKFNIETPKIVSRSDAIDIGESERKRLENELELELDDDINPAISIIRKFEDMGFAKKDGVERAIQLSYYIETKLGLDCFKIYCSMLEYIIKSSGVKELEQDLTSIQNGARFNITEEPKIRIMNTFMRVTDNFLKELLEPETEPEAEPKEIIDEKPLLVRIYEAYRMLENPEKYKIDKWREREAIKKEEFMKKGIEILREVFDNE